ncbi:transposable element Tc1 transposase [Trichonephila clavipes]|nr:transposable element Tc1 transposase [Trichonephila clavipes]
MVQRNREKEQKQQHINWTENLSLKSCLQQVPEITTKCRLPGLTSFGLEKLVDAQIATDVHDKFNRNTCVDTARKILKKAGYRSRVARRKPYISMTNRLKQIAFAKEHINNPPEFWRTVIFSYESKFCNFGINGMEKTLHSASKRAFSTNGEARRWWSYGVGVHDERWCWQAGVYRINHEQI